MKLDALGRKNSAAASWESRRKMGMVAGRGCLSKCPGGNKCHCDGPIHHVFHICSDPSCECHGAERYGVPGGWTIPRPIEVVQRGRPWTRKGDLW